MQTHSASPQAGRADNCSTSNGTGSERGTVASGRSRRRDHRSGLRRARINLSERNPRQRPVALRSGRFAARCQARYVTLAF
ncbi:MAG: hypothetical protein AVDCRST_MAG93-4070 [uncultured Chloroflexia bacterium]|uniref:Uncharacterized protein n=1 Tax=uncultured Chloroflexia bacterium TaxID=1672391 RepID=A0A6J4K1N5_9CHLR|nr:MAG: hypothetical protein AVDCRST_MAG93-4070 [uncultured Chloroflexia bacterium]